MRQRTRIALVAHDNTKPDLMEWAALNKPLLVQHELYATGTKGKLLEQELEAPCTSCGADRSEGISTSEPASRKGASMSSSSSGILCNPCRTTPTSRRCGGSPRYGTSRWPAPVR